MGISLLMWSLTILLCQSLGAQQIGPDKGTCMVIGGGHLDRSIYEAFAQAAGGFDQRTIIIPTAVSSEPEKMDSGFVKLKQRFIDQGFTNIEIIHASSKAMADQDSFAWRIHSAQAVWFTGGRQWRLVDAYAETKSMEAFRAVLEKGGVIAGTSAGATIQGSFLARGDTQTNTIMMGDHQKGFGFIQNVAIDQHVLRRNRHYDLFEILEQHPQLLGIGLDENTAFVIQGDTAKVVGQSYVLIYDGKRYDAKTNKFIEDQSAFHLLSDGQLYDLQDRRIVHAR